MPLTIDWEKVYSHPQVENHDYSAGVVLFTDPRSPKYRHSLLAGLADSTDFEPHQLILRSRDFGETWEQVARFQFNQPARGPRFLHFPEGILCFPEIADFKDLNVKRSTNSGDSWSTAASFTGTLGFPNNQARLVGARSYGRTAGYFCGHIPDNAGALTGNFVRTTNSGASWTLGPQLTTGGNSSVVNAIAAGAGGLMWCSGNGNRNFATPDNGDNWTEIAQCPDPATSTFIEVSDLASLTNALLIAGGIGNPQGGAKPAYLWRSTNAGVSWTAIASSAISDWPSSGNLPWITSLHRLNKTSCLLGLQTRANAGDAPVRLSIDNGQNWDFTGDGWDLGGVIAEMGGAVAVSPSQDIFLVVDVTDISRNTSEIWRGTVRC